jgi:hypothetical protein
VKILHSTEVVDGTSSLQVTWDTDTQVEYHPFWLTRKVYICHNGFSDHKGDEDRCRYHCMRAQGAATGKYVDEAVQKMVVTKKQVIFKERG